MTTETNSDKQTEPRLLSEAEIDAVVGGMVAGSTLLAMALYREKCTSQMLPPGYGGPYC
jgi:hypothetical protein